MEKLANFLLALLQKAAVEAVLKKLILSSAGLKAWLVKFLIENLFDHIVEPLGKFLIDNGVLFYDKTKGKILIGKIDSARENHNRDDYRRHIDTLFK